MSKSEFIWIWDYRTPSSGSGRLRHPACGKSVRIYRTDREEYEKRHRCEGSSWFGKRLDYDRMSGQKASEI